MVDVLPSELWTCSVGEPRTFQWIHEFYNWMMWFKNQDPSSITNLDSLEEMAPCDNMPLERNLSSSTFMP